MPERIRVSRDTYKSALADAIDWQQSLLEACDNEESRREARKLLARYRMAYKHVTGEGHERASQG